MTSVDILSYLSKQACGAPRTYIIFITELKRGVTVRYEREVLNDTDEIHVVVVRCRGGQDTKPHFSLRVHSRDFPVGAGPRPRRQAQADQALKQFQVYRLHDGFNNTSTGAKSAPSIYLGREQGV